MSDQELSESLLYQRIVVDEKAAYLIRLLIRVRSAMINPQLADLAVFANAGANVMISMVSDHLCCQAERRLALIVSIVQRYVESPGDHSCASVNEDFFLLPPQQLDSAKTIVS